MLKQDLRVFKCPQQFIQFKLGLRQALLAQQTIEFRILEQQPIQDIERFLQKNNYQYKLEQQHGLLIVEPNCV
ncbi:hypothetical protein AMS58_13045 [Pseudoalteromonas porphyrae]|uniref:Uncharacterized protein n=2 Tax=Pseudoalteromonas TaxID=53246 RepID=A0A0N1MUW3_9GAMM|nr:MULTISPECIES: hypothetical protein [Pseudoalteromonas]KPH63243.1 hypothetical protein ADS77_09890 [Pseudoalteromonas porphyrae]KPH94225.1 hypothetical protein AMS58_13045 [Pseudoalteromonas porphyrae]NMR25252.1 hypothetical protein [Pseudoalteromonas sp. NEC-BIFX-2020_015]NNG42882.1 hypothetical protein [Pseudoalteromonas sp. NEC-BIFX-2020_002]